MSDHMSRDDALDILLLTVQPIVMAMPLDVSDGFTLTGHEAKELREAWRAVVYAEQQTRLIA